MTSEKHPVDFGARLRAARERRGLSLRVIADATKISVRALEAVERNDISQLPGGIFSRAFVRAYAVEVGLDPEQTIADFITRFPHETVTQGHPRTRAIIDELDAITRRRRWPGSAWVLVTVPLVALMVYVALGAFRVSSNPVQSVAPEVQAAAATVGDGPFNLTLHALRATRCTLAVDGAATFELTLEAGATRTIEMHEQLIVIPADAGALEWSAGGVSHALGGPFTVTRDMLAGTTSRR